MKPDTVTRRRLAEWLRYLADIGVRELRVPAIPVTACAAAARGGPRSQPQRGPASDTSASPAASSTEAQPALAIWPTSGPAGDPAAALAEIRDDLGECSRCRLHEGRTRLVYGVGDPRARLMFVGEGPGADEDAQGEPFVGRAGRKLNEMIRAIGLEREQVYIANVVKCRPPENRDPRPDEVAVCSPFLLRQIDAIRPRVIVTLGSPATKLLLNTSAGITRLRGTWQEFRGIPVMPTYHPAYLLRAYTPENRRKVYDDLKQARARLDGA